MYFFLAYIEKKTQLNDIEAVTESHSGKGVLKTQEKSSKKTYEEVYFFSNFSDNCPANHSCFSIKNNS